MSQTGIFIIFILIFTAVFILVGFIGNKVVDKGSDALRNKSVRKYNANQIEPEKKLSDVYKKDSEH